MAKAYGFIEITGVTASINALDTMCKTADVQCMAVERKWGGRLVTIVISGEVAAVNEAIAQAKATEIKKIVASGVLPNPHPEIIRLINERKN